MVKHYPIEIARGCIFKCAFCFFDLIGKRKGDWTKTEDTIYNEMMYNFEKFGTTQYMVSDELVNESVEKVQMLARIAKNCPFKLEYTAYARLDLIVRYREMILCYNKAVQLDFQSRVETFNRIPGKAVGKGVDPNVLKNTLRECKKQWKNNVVISANFIIGLPYESKKDIEQTIEYLLS